MRLTARPQKGTIVMKHFFSSIAFLGLSLLSTASFAEDIDIFASGLTSSAADDSLPNVIIVLDNTSNWARQSQQWPDRDTDGDGDLESETQGQAEVAAIRGALEGIAGDINIALLEFTTAGNAGQDGAFVRFGLKQFSTNKPAFYDTLNTIYGDINGSAEKRNSNTSYGNLISDVHNYLSGGLQSIVREGQASSGSTGTPSLADTSAYVNGTPYSVFQSPLSSSDVCAETYVIFVSNPNSSGPSNDDAANSVALKNLYQGLGETNPHRLAGDTVGTPRSMREFAEVTGSAIEYGFSEQCYESVSSCTANINGNSGESEIIQANCATESDCSCLGGGSNRTKRASDGGNCEKVGNGNNAQQWYRYTVAGENSGSIIATDTYDETGGADFNLDDWTQFLKEYGVELEVTSGSGASGSTESYRVPVTTFTLDVYNKQPNVTHSSLMDSAAAAGGGYRLSASNFDELQTALKRIFGDIIGASSSFAAVTLPLSASQQGTSENQVFIGVFRPAKERKPRWPGNLKQYKLGLIDGNVELVDANGDIAVNSQTGFIGACATSAWTTDTSQVAKSGGTTGPYFEGLGLDPNPVSECDADFLNGRSVLSDSPDGPFVEKGGAAQQIRGQHNSGSSTRNIFLATSSGTSLSLSDLTASDLPGVSSAVASATYTAGDVFDYVHGEDPGLAGGDPITLDSNASYIENDAILDREIMPADGLRASIHGDIIHSRPLTLTYGSANGSTEFRVFYGSNDGLYRALDPTTGNEEWSMMSESHLSEIERQYANSPSVDYDGLEASFDSQMLATFEPKPYFFDGSTGVYLDYSESSGSLETAWIYPTMRRGGRVLYGLDVSPENGSPPSASAMKSRSGHWKVGCDASGCTTGFNDIGQTWSTPVAGLVDEAGNGVGVPAIIFGGGWDACLDADQKAFPSSCETGNSVYIVEATTGRLIKEFKVRSDGSSPSELKHPIVGAPKPIYLDNDDFVDLIYVVSAAGGIHRISLSDLSPSDPDFLTQRGVANWSMTRIAQSGRAGTRFLNDPFAVRVAKGTVAIGIGSGDRERPLKENYPYDTQMQNRFYLFIDKPYPSGVLENIDTRTAIDLDVTSNNNMLDAAVGLGEGESLYRDYNGWFFDLSKPGEQIVTPAATAAGIVFFNSYIPEGGASGICANLGTARGYAVRLREPYENDGTEIQGSGFPIPPVIADVDIEGDGDPEWICIACVGDPDEGAPTPDPNDPDSVDDDCNVSYQGSNSTLGGGQFVPSACGGFEFNYRVLEADSE